MFKDIFPLYAKGYGFSFTNLDILDKESCFQKPAIITIDTISQTASNQSYNIEESNVSTKVILS